jgi:hypothetical protein
MPPAIARDDLAPWLSRLRALPVIAEVRALPSSTPDCDARLILRLPKGEKEYCVEVKRTARLGFPFVAELAARRRRAPETSWMLLAPRISTEVGKRLQDIGVDYLDLEGNCHLEPAPGIYVHVEGKRPSPDAEREDGRAHPRGGGLHVLFALAARPDLAASPVRELACLAGAGKSTVSAMLKRLEGEGLVGVSAGQRRVLQPRKLRDRWLSAYAETLRPRWIRGRFRAETESPRVLERRVAAALEGSTWAWGGTVAASRLAKYYRGGETLVHVAKPMPDFPKKIRALPDRNGPLVVVLLPIPLAFEGPAPHIPHPLVVYSELLASPDERAQSAAEVLRERFLEPRA